MNSNLLAAICGLYILGSMIIWHSGSYPSFAQGYGYGYGYGVEDFQRVQHSALVALYHNTNGDDWTRKDSWLGEAGTECSWYGVQCESKSVWGISLYENSLSGSIPTELGNLSNLTSLNLWGNSLSGSIPTELGNLSKLDYLRLAANSLSGRIPTELGNLSNLTYLNLSQNSLSGSIPSELGNLSNLTHLNLDQNSLSGSIPTELGNLSNLTHLNLGQNSLSGSIPSELENLGNLRFLRLNKNSLSGSIPTELGNLGNLRLLTLSKNSLSGSIPTELGNLEVLQYLYLYSNSLSGGITELANLGNLSTLDLSNNQLSGSLAPLGELENLRYLFIQNNRFSKPLPTWSSGGPTTIDSTNAFNEPPVVVITASAGTIVDTDGIAGERVNLTASVTLGDGPIVRAYWHYQGSLISDDYVTSFRFPDGPNTVSFTAVDDLGDIDSEELVIQVNEPMSPTAQILNGNPEYQDTDGAVGETIKFTGQGEDQDGQIKSYAWEVNGLLIERGPNATLALPNGKSIVRLVVTDNVGLKGTYDLETIVFPPAYISSNSWPAPYNGITPDSIYRLNANNIGVVDRNIGVMQTCIKFVKNGSDHTIDGLTQIDANFHLWADEDQVFLRLFNLRPFNETGSLTDYDELPDCVGRYDVESGIYYDVIAFGEGVYEAVFQLSDRELNVFTTYSIEKLQPQ